MDEYFKVMSISFVLITKMENNRKYILLQERINTGRLDGEYDVSCSGHLENNETSKDAAIREAFEELGIKIKKENLNFITAINAKYGKDQYVSMAFWVDKYEGSPIIKELDKCSNLKWFPIDELPNNISKHAFLIIHSYKNNNHYINIGY